MFVYLYVPFLPELRSNISTSSWSSNSKFRHILQKYFLNNYVQFLTLRSWFRSYLKATSSERIDKKVVIIRFYKEKKYLFNAEISVTCSNSFAEFMWQWIKHGMMWVDAGQSVFVELFSNDGNQFLHACLVVRPVAHNLKAMRKITVCVRKIWLQFQSRTEMHKKQFYYYHFFPPNRITSYLFFNFTKCDLKNDILFLDFFFFFSSWLNFVGVTAFNKKITDKIE